MHFLDYNFGSGHVDPSPATNPSAYASMVNDSGQDQIAALAQKLGIKLDDTTKDYLIEYYLNDRASSNAFNREMSAYNSRYQNAVEDMRKAGLNPFLAFDAISGAGANSSASGVSGGLYTQKGNSLRQTGTSLISTILSMVASAVIAGLMIAAA